jgi:hypothetical protein
LEIEMPEMRFSRGVLYKALLTGESFGGDMNALSVLEKWYTARCYGSWEHRHGVRILTLDNPGWSVEIDLRGTQAEERVLEPVRVDRAEKDWLHYWVAEKKFHARVGPQNLSESVEIFSQWFEKPD